MGLYEDQLAKIQRTEDFLKRQVDLSDDNKRDVLDALITNTWGTNNRFFISGVPIERVDTSINLNKFLKERGIDPNNLPEFIGSDIFKAEKLTDTRLISELIPLGSGIDLRDIADLERGSLYGLTQQQQDRDALDSLKRKVEDTKRDNTSFLDLQQSLNNIMQVANQNATTYITNQRDLNPTQVTMQDDLENANQAGSSEIGKGIALVLAVGILGGGLG